MVSAVGALSCAAVGDIYVDPTGDIATGNPNLDITQVEVTDDGTDLTMTLSLASLDGADWGNYMVFVDHSDGGSGDNDNPWGRDIGGLGGVDYFLGSWLSGGGGWESHGYDNGGWYPEDASYGLGSAVDMTVDWASSSITWVFRDVVAGAAAGDGFDFEVATTGGNWGDPAIDLLGGEGTQPGWGQGSTSIDLMHYEFSQIPAPGVVSLLVVAGLARRRRQ
jgi:hypothetical protein